MIETVDTQALKNKFGVLLSKLYTNSKMPFDVITQKILIDDYFDFLERQDSGSFLMKSYEEIARDVFKCEFVFSENLVSEIYWAGQMYMTISLNCQIPLKQLFLICPLEKMVSHFEIYHEMNDQQFVSAFLGDEYKTSILRTLRKKSGLSTRVLSVCSGVAEHTIKYYEKDNSHLFNASFENICGLRRVLNCSESLLKRQSDFIPCCDAFFTNKELFAKLCAKLDNIYGSHAIYEFDGLMVKKINAQGKGKTRFVESNFVYLAIKQVVADYEIKDSSQLLF